MSDKLTKSDEEWRRELTPEQYYVLRQKGTEPAFSGKLLNRKEAGTYHCAGCGQALFNSAGKFESGTGWPSFWEPVADDNLRTEEDRSLGAVRTEVMCARCDGHLGHVFPDGPQPTGLRYCMNSLAMTLKPEEKS